MWAKKDVKFSMSMNGHKEKNISNGHKTNDGE